MGILLRIFIGIFVLGFIAAIRMLEGVTDMLKDGCKEIKKKIEKK